MIRGLNLQCQQYFSNLRVHSGQIRLLQNPFDFNTEEEPPELHTQLTDSHGNSALKDKCKEENLITSSICLSKDHWSLSRN
jgi:hypothetical protein